MPGRVDSSGHPKKNYKSYGFFVVSFLLVSTWAFVVSTPLFAGVSIGAFILAESLPVLSEPPAFFSELQLIAIEPTKTAIIAKLKIFFFIRDDLFLTNVF